MKEDDKVRFFNARTGEIMEETYTIVEVLDNKSVKVKHPSISGYFVFYKSAVAEIVYEDRGSSKGQTSIS